MTKNNLFYPRVLMAICLFYSLASCNNNQISVAQNSQDEAEMDVIEADTIAWINEKGMDLKSRFNVPSGYTRVASNENSWQAHLLYLPLKSHGSLVKLYDGRIKGNTSVYLAVVDLPIGTKDLHQCADGVMRLRADYLFAQKRFDEIEFLFVSGAKSNYVSYLNGKAPDKTNYWAYMEYVFNSANTYSLEKQLKKKEMKDLEIGDALIKGGFPGHTVIVVDKCINTSSGAVKYMLAQSYMPAQELQILVNPLEPESPWYDLTTNPVIQTAEWDFTADQLRSF